VVTGGRGKDLKATKSAVYLVAPPVSLWPFFPPVQHSVQWPLLTFSFLPFHTRASSFCSARHRKQQRILHSRHGRGHARHGGQQLKRRKWRIPRPGRQHHGIPGLPGAAAAPG